VSFTGVARLGLPSCKGFVSKNNFTFEEFFKRFPPLHQNLYVYCFIHYGNWFDNWLGN
jgi:hypothetical protein